MKRFALYLLLVILPISAQADQTIDKIKRLYNGYGSVSDNQVKAMADKGDGEAAFVWSLRLQYEQQNKAAASQYVQKSAELGYTFPHYFYGNQLVADNKFAQAKAQYEQGKAEWDDACGALAVLYLQRGTSFYSPELSYETLKGDGCMASPLSQRALGYLYAGLGEVVEFDFQKAIDLLTPALEENDEVAWFYIGMGFLRVNQIDDAKEVFTQQANRGVFAARVMLERLTPLDQQQPICLDLASGMRLISGDNHPYEKIEMVDCNEQGMLRIEAN